MWTTRFLIILLIVIGVLCRNDGKNDPRSNGDLALWIDEKQVKMFSGLYLQILFKFLYIINFNSS